MRLKCFQVAVSEKSVVSSQPSFILSDFYSNSFTCRNLILLRSHNHIFYYLWEPIASSWATSHSLKVWLWLELKLNEVWVFTFYFISLVEERGVTWAHCLSWISLTDYALSSVEFTWVTSIAFLLGRLPTQNCWGWLVPAANCSMSVKTYISYGPHVLCAHCLTHIILPNTDHRWKLSLDSMPCPVHHRNKDAWTPTWDPCTNNSHHSKWISSPPAIYSQILLQHKSS